MFSHDLDVASSFLSIYGIEPMLSAVDYTNGCFASHSPLFSEVSNVCDVFVLALMLRFIDARYLIFGHNCPLCTAFTSLSYI